MPAKPLTIILNSNHTKKSTVVLPVPIPRDRILAEGRNKFRVKALSRVFLKGGQELTGDVVDEDVKEVYLSKGEEYMGPPPKGGAQREGAPAELRVIAENSAVDEQAVTQLKEVSKLPGVHVAVGMPDLHPGNRFPVGCAIAAEGVYPALIGSDIGCGIALYSLSALPSHLTPQKLASRLRDLDNPWDGDVPAWLRQYSISRESKFDLGSLGTVGGGNHFAEVCTVERIVDNPACETLNLKEKWLYLLVHTGSRGLGGSILAEQIRLTGESNPYIPPSTEALDAYLAEHDYAVQWAIANRDLVAHRIKQCLFPSDSPDDDPDLQKIIDVTHNSVVQSDLEVAGVSRQLWIHRKGAAPADRGIAPCPGSRGDFSWLLMPTGDGNHNAKSLAHGAGRLHARSSAALQSLPTKTSLTTTSLGSQVVCADPDLLIEERPEAYKPVQAVVDDLEAAGAAKGVAVLRPFVTFKVGESRRG